MTIRVTAATLFLAFATRAFAARQMSFDEASRYCRDRVVALGSRDIAKNQCLNGNWKKMNSYASEADCVSDVDVIVMGLWKNCMVHMGFDGKAPDDRWPR